MATAEISRALLKANRLLEQYRRRDGVTYRPPSRDTTNPAGDLIKQYRELVTRAQKSADNAGADRVGELPERVKTYPTLNVALYRASPAAGRVLYLLQAYDVDGRGWLDVEAVRALLCDDGSPWKVYGWRRLRQIFAEGESLGLWHRDDQGRIWLHSAAKIASALETGRLRGRPVYLPIDGLLESLKHAKAHFYASWESGRPVAKEGYERPISRQALANVTGVPERRQREYDELLGRERQTNVIVTDELYTTENVQEYAWQKGYNVMRFTDWTGKRGGEAGAEYIAYQLPSSRERAHGQAPKGRQRKHNQDVTLVTNPEQGPDVELVRAYHPNDVTAASAFNRNPDIEHYYPEERNVMPDAAAVARLQGVMFWSVLYQ